MKNSIIPNKILQDSLCLKFTVYKGIKNLKTHFPNPFSLLISRPYCNGHRTMAEQGPNTSTDTLLAFSLSVAEAFF